MRANAIVTLPHSDQTTMYISTWAEQTLQELKSKEFNFIKLAKEKANSSMLTTMLKKHSPSFLFLNGHGGPDFVCGHNDEIIVGANMNEHILKDTVVYALSCSSAKILGLKAIKAGTISYVGYKEDFIFFISREKRTRPKEDKTAQMFLRPANHIVVSLIKGHTIIEAINSTKKYFLKNMQKLISSESSTEDREYIRYLLWDLQSLTSLGNQEARVISK